MYNGPARALVLKGADWIERDDAAGQRVAGVHVLLTLREPMDRDELGHVQPSVANTSAKDI